LLPDAEGALALSGSQFHAPDCPNLVQMMGSIPQGVQQALPTSVLQRRLLRAHSGATCDAAEFQAHEPSM
jgi:hypothetical protein